MSRAQYIGDEAHAAAWRLVGVDTRVVTEPAQAATALDEARREADLVLLAPALAPALTPVERRALAPLMLALPDARGPTPPAELAQRVRKLLGMDS